MKFVDVKNDVAFHKIFGDSNKTVTLISFLNAAMSLEGQNRVATVSIENPYLFPISHGGKTIVIDIRATDQQGRHFIVEMQVADKEGFEKRTQFYVARDYASQIDSGEHYKELRPTHFIGILNFRFGNNPNYYSHHQTIDIDTGECLLKDMQYFFIELPKFQKTLTQLENMMDKWTFFIKNAENLNMIPSDVTDEGLKTAYLSADKHNWNKKELNAYYDAGARDADQEQERIKAENKGRLEGKIEGKIEGKLEEKIAVAKSGISKGYSNEVIADLTGLSMEEIETIRNELNH